MEPHFIFCVDQKCSSKSIKLGFTYKMRPTFWNILFSLSICVMWKDTSWTRLTWESCRKWWTEQWQWRLQSPPPKGSIRRVRKRPRCSCCWSAWPSWWSGPGRATAWWDQCAAVSQSWSWKRPWSCPTPEIKDAVNSGVSLLAGLLAIIVINTTSINPLIIGLDR